MAACRERLADDNIVSWQLKAVKYWEICVGVMFDEYSEQNNLSIVQTKK